MPKNNNNIEIMKKIVITTIFLSWVLFLSGCSNNNEWTGFYYKDKNNIGNQKNWIIQPGLKSKDDCRAWVVGMAKNNTNYDYECGYKCRFDKAYNLTICKETVK